MKKTFILFISFIMAVLLCGCGAKVDADVQISDTGSGSRTFVVSMAKSELKGMISKDKVENSIKKSCPECLESTFAEDGKNYTATFVLNFDSVEDYEQKLNTFCKKSADVNLEITPSPFMQKVVYSENLTTKEMLSWLVDALIGDGVVDAKYRNSVFETVQTSLTLGGREYDAGEGRITVNEEKYCSVESIDLYTMPAEEGKFSRVIKFNLQDAEYSKNEQAIRAFMEESIPAGGTGVWEDDTEAGRKTFSVSLTGLSASEMAEAMKAYTRSDDCSFTEEDSPNAVGVFCKDAAFSESLNFSAYACNSSGTVKVNYMFDENLTGGDLMDKLNSNPVSPSETVTTGSNTYLVYSLGETDKCNIFANMVRYYHFSGIDYILDAKGPDEISKEIDFYFDEQGTKEIGDAYDKIRVMGEVDETVAQIKVSLNDDKLSLLFEGSASDINHMTEAITGKKAAGISYAYENKWLSPTTKCVVVDAMDLDGFVYQDPQESEYWQIPVRYTARIYGSGKKVYPKIDGLSKRGKGYTGVIPASKRVKLTFRTNRMNKTAFLWYLLMFGALVFIVGGAYFKITGEKEERKERSSKAREKAKAYDEELKKDKEKAVRKAKEKAKEEPKEEPAKEPSDEPKEETEAQPKEESGEALEEASEDGPEEEQDEKD